MKTVTSALLCLWASTALPQADSSKKCSDILRLNGYIKNMQMLSFDNELRDIVNDNLIHNRLNFRCYPIKNTEIALELRNRIFTGESVDANPAYGDMADVDNGYVDMSWLLLDKPSLVFLTQIDRAWAEWAKGQWEIRAGRQRINWGANTFWNSNDLFNAYSLVDFDYEELPGADALRIHRFFGDMSGLDLAVQPGKSASQWVAAGRYHFNKWQYDFQLIGAWWHEDVALGAGWAGNAGNAGFKGEATWFQPQEQLTDTTGVLSASISADYVFPNELYLTLGALFNSGGIDTAMQYAQNIMMEPLTAKNLMPTKYSVILNMMYPATPLLNCSFMLLYAPGVNLAFAMPSLSYS
ncbi:MAG: hypothetical protein ACE5DN_07595, partial [Flavobacteriales bacterium]